MIWKNDHIYTCCYSSPLGNITLAGNGSALTGLWFEGQRFFGSTLSKNTIPSGRQLFSQTIRWLDIYFSGNAPDFLPSVSIFTTPFRKMVCEIMLTIPFGQTMTYGEIAAEIAEIKGIKHMSAQAVGGAVSHNPISIIIPCHRVIGSGGKLTGYAAGPDKKISLLKLEGISL